MKPFYFRNPIRLEPKALRNVPSANAGLCIGQGLGYPAVSQAGLSGHETRRRKTAHASSSANAPAGPSDFADRSSPLGFAEASAGGSGRAGASMMNSWRVSVSSPCTIHSIRPLNLHCMCAFVWVCARNCAGGWKCVRARVRDQAVEAVYASLRVCERSRACVLVCFSVCVRAGVLCVRACVSMLPHAHECVCPRLRLYAHKIRSSSSACCERTRRACSCGAICAPRAVRRICRRMSACRAG